MDEWKRRKEQRAAEAISAAAASFTDGGDYGVSGDFGGGGEPAGDYPPISDLPPTPITGGASPYFPGQVATEPAGPPAPVQSPYSPDEEKHRLLIQKQRMQPRLDAAGQRRQLREEGQAAERGDILPEYWRRLKGLGADVLGSAPVQGTLNTLGDVVSTLGAPALTAGRAAANIAMGKTPLSAEELKGAAADAAAGFRRLGSVFASPILGSAGAKQLMGVDDAKQRPSLMTQTLGESGEALAGAFSNNPDLTLAERIRMGVGGAAGGAAALFSQPGFGPVFGAAKGASGAANRAILRGVLGDLPPGPIPFEKAMEAVERVAKINPDVGKAVVAGAQEAAAAGRRAASAVYDFARDYIPQSGEAIAAGGVPSNLATARAQKFAQTFWKAYAKAETLAPEEATTAGAGLAEAYRGLSPASQKVVRDLINAKGVEDVEGFISSKIMQKGLRPEPAPPPEGSAVPRDRTPEAMGPRTESMERPSVKELQAKYERMGLIGGDLPPAPRDVEALGGPPAAQEALSDFDKWMARRKDYGEIGREIPEAPGAMAQRWAALWQGSTERRPSITPRTEEVTKPEGRKAIAEREAAAAAKEFEPPTGPHPVTAVWESMSEQTPPEAIDRAVAALQPLPADAIRNIAESIGKRFTGTPSKPAMIRAIDERLRNQQRDATRSGSLAESVPSYVKSESMPVEEPAAAPPAEVGEAFEGDLPAAGEDWGAMPWDELPGVAPQKAAGKKFTFKDAESELDGDPLSHFTSGGAPRISIPPKGKRSGELEEAVMQGFYQSLSPTLRSKIFVPGESENLDQVAQYFRDRGLLDESDDDTRVFDLIREGVESRQRLVESRRSEAASMKAMDDFAAATAKPAKGKTEIDASALQPGDTFQVKGETFRVMRPEEAAIERTGKRQIGEWFAPYKPSSVLVEDGEKFGIQEVEGTVHLKDFQRAEPAPAPAGVARESSPAQEPISGQEAVRIEGTGQEVRAQEGGQAGPGATPAGATAGAPAGEATAGVSGAEAPEGGPVAGQPRVEKPYDPLAPYLAERDRISRVLDEAKARGMDLEKFKDQQQHLDVINRAIKAIQEGGFQKENVGGGKPDLQTPKVEKGVPEEFRDPDPRYEVIPYPTTIDLYRTETKFHGQRYEWEDVPHELPHTWPPPTPTGPARHTKKPGGPLTPRPTVKYDWGDTSWPIIAPELADTLKSYAQGTDKKGTRHPALNEFISRLFSSESRAAARAHLLPEMEESERGIMKGWAVGKTVPVEELTANMVDPKQPRFIVKKATAALDSYANAALGLGYYPRFASGEAQDWIDVIRRSFRQTGALSDGLLVVQTPKGNFYFGYNPDRYRLEHHHNYELDWMGEPGDANFRAYTEDLANHPINKAWGTNLKDLRTYLSEQKVSPDRKTAMEAKRLVAYVPDQWESPIDGKTYWVNRRLLDLIPNNENPGASIMRDYLEKLTRISAVEEWGTPGVLEHNKFLNYLEEPDGLMERIVAESGPNAKKIAEQALAGLYGKRGQASWFATMPLENGGGWSRAVAAAMDAWAQWSVALSGPKSATQTMMEIPAMAPGYLNAAKRTLQTPLVQAQQMVGDFLRGVGMEKAGNAVSMSPRQVLAHLGVPLTNLRSASIRNWKNALKGEPDPFTIVPFSMSLEGVSQATARGVERLMHTVGSMMAPAKFVNEYAAGMNDAVAGEIGKLIGGDWTKFALKGKLREADFLQMERSSLHPEIIQDLRDLNDLATQGFNVTLNQGAAQMVAQDAGRTTAMETQFRTLSPLRSQRILNNSVTRRLFMFLRYQMMTLRHSEEFLHDAISVLKNPKLDWVGDNSKASNIAYLAYKFFIRLAGAQASGEVQRAIADAFGRERSDLEEEGLGGRMLMNLAYANLLGPLWLSIDWMLQKGGVYRPHATRDGREEKAYFPFDPFPAGIAQDLGAVGAEAVGEGAEAMGFERKPGFEDRSVLDEAVKAFARKPGGRAAAGLTIGNEATDEMLSRPPKAGGRSPYSGLFKRNQAGTGAGARQGSPYKGLFKREPGRGGPGGGSGGRGSPYRGLFKR